MKRLGESLRRADAALEAARKHVIDVEALIHQERATRTERDDAARDVRFRQAERDRLGAALAAATAPPPAIPAPVAIVADASLILLRTTQADGAQVASGQSIAVLTPRTTRLEAALGRTHAPEEGATVRVRAGGTEFTGRIAGIHVEDRTRTVTVEFDPPTPLAAGTHVELQIGR